MLYLADRNILLRSINPADPQYPVTRVALAKLISINDVVYITARNLIEFRHVATRPLAANGLGWTSTQAAQVSLQLEAQFGFLPEVPSILQHWKSLVDATGTVGRPVHDARLAAVALTCGIANVLTFNVTDFSRFMPHGVVPIDPSSI